MSLITEAGEVWVYRAFLSEPWQFKYKIPSSIGFVDVTQRATHFIGITALGEIWTWTVDQPPNVPSDDPIDLPDGETWSAIDFADPGRSIVSSEDGDMYWVCVGHCSDPQLEYIGNPLADPSPIVPTSWGGIKASFHE
jgi:hypothetical protein